ncbi:unnamed protein product [Orchesella dallaii]|uniref:Uncharacterized protein n=1 Tax=Orchesella dallaii TaxID=48710 RepID=A0ABP1R8Z7_9HEXA
MGCSLSKYCNSDDTVEPTTVDLSEDKMPANGLTYDDLGTTNGMAPMKIVELMPHETESDISEIMFVDAGSESESEESISEKNYQQETEFGAEVKTVSQEGAEKEEIPLEN